MIRGDLINSFIAASGKFLIFLFFLLLPKASFAESVTYRLNQLSFVGMSGKSTTPKMRLYIKFKKLQSTHTLIYEEDPSLGALREITSLLQAAAAPNTVCSLEMDCSVKAFCTNDCQAVYYEFTNQPAPAPIDLKDSRNYCKLKSFDCTFNGGLAGSNNGTQ